MSVPDSRELLRCGFARLGPAKASFGLYPELVGELPILSQSADPDMALLQMTRMLDEGIDIWGLKNGLGARLWRRQVRLLGGSRALGDYEIARPQALVIRETELDPRSEILAAVGADPSSPRPVAADFDRVDQMRRRYRELLTYIAAADFDSDFPLEAINEVAGSLALLADAAIEGALAIARAKHDPGATVALSVIALGKTGAKELNYISDVDVMFVAEAASSEQIAIATEMAKTISVCCSAPGFEPPLWTLDVGLRPEGRDGALVRTIESALDYYKKWAADWEFQALLKARPAAGDFGLGQTFVNAVEPLVWSAASRPGFVRKTRQMRVQVEESVRLADRKREIKLSAGGLRDVEFTVQLLQLVHGQDDESVRVPNTLEAIDALQLKGYVARAHASELDYAYRFLRLTEHRIQLRSMRRTHSLPGSDDARRALIRGIDKEKYSTWEAFEADLNAIRKQVRLLHEDVFFRPIVAASATMGGEGNLLAEEEAEDRLRLIGYSNPVGALRSIAALTEGTSRRAMIQRNLAPVIIRWLAEGADPDMGILSFRTLSEQIGASHWYLALLRDSASAAKRLCRVLSNSRWAEGALSTIPRAISWLDSDTELQPSKKEDLRAEARALLNRHGEPESAMGRVSTIVTREVTRAGLSDATMGVQGWRSSLAAAVDVAVEAALRIALREQESLGQGPVRMCAIALGRFGGNETTYASDIDLMFVHEGVGGTEESDAQGIAAEVANRTRSLLAAHRQEAMVGIDLDLRPEGRTGALSRTIESYREYYRRWASPWERQALVRARFVAGDGELGQLFEGVADALRWDAELSANDVRDIRLLKARMENERLPRGANPANHVKLGPGGLTDVEWTVQLLQMKYARDYPQLRTTSTLPAIKALVATGLLMEAEGEDLSRAWTLASQIRSANVLASARLGQEVVDSLPKKPELGARVAALLGLGTDGEARLVDQWRFAARRARLVMDAKFWV